jgi:hypothetical protein
MELNGTNIKQHLSTYYCCEKCNYNTVRKNNYTTHLLSAKHTKELNGTNIMQQLYCAVCNKIYKTSAGLWKHKKKCVVVEPPLAQTELIMDVLQQNKELNKLLMEQTAEHMAQTAELHTKVLELSKNAIINNTINNNSFNLQIYLNETCKDAVNLEDFGKETILQLSDLDKIGRVGFVDGMTDIIVTRLTTLDVNKRPIHCTDAKREVFYVRDNDKWEKDEGNKKINRLILRMDRKLAPLLIVFGQNHTNLGYSTDSEIIKHQSIVCEILGGKDDDATNAAAIVRRLSKKICIEKAK